VMVVAYLLFMCFPVAWLFSGLV